MGRGFRWVAAVVAMAVAGAPCGGAPQTPGDTKLLNQSPAPPPAWSSQGTFTPVGSPPRAPDSPVMSLSLASPADIGPKQAQIILKAMGLMDQESYAEALGDLRYTHSYMTRKKSSVLTAQDKQWLYDDCMQLKVAIARYAESPDISSDDPRYSKWVDEAAAQMTARGIPASKRRKLVQALLQTESTKQHWVHFVPIESSVGATGFGQLLAATAQDPSVNVNRFDPRENLIGSARYLNSLIKQYGLTGGLARYNGGLDPPRSAYRYASLIIARMNR